MRLEHGVKQTIGAEGKIYPPTLPSFRVLFFVLVPLGSRSHFQLPTLSYLKGSPEEAEAWARSTVRRIWVSTLDLVPPSGRLGNMIGKLGPMSQWCGKDGV